MIQCTYVHSYNILIHKNTQKLSICAKYLYYKLLIFFQKIRKHSYTLNLITTTFITYVTTYLIQHASKVNYTTTLLRSSNTDRHPKWPLIAAHMQGVPSILYHTITINTYYASIRTQLIVYNPSHRLHYIIAVSYTTIAYIHIYSYLLTYLFSSNKPYNLILSIIYDIFTSIDMCTYL